MFFELIVIILLGVLVYVLLVRSPASSPFKAMDKDVLDRCADKAGEDEKRFLQHLKEEGIDIEPFEVTDEAAKEEGDDGVEGFSGDWYTSRYWWNRPWRYSSWNYSPYFYTTYPYGYYLSAYKWRCSSPISLYGSCPSGTLKTIFSDGAYRCCSF